MFHNDSSIIITIRLFSFTLLLLATAALAHDCPANYRIAGLVADSRLLATSRGQSQLTFAHTFDQALPSTPGVAIAIQDIAFSGVEARTFSVFPQNRSRSEVMFMFTYSSSWNKIRINFWASSNEYIQTGIVSIQKSSLTLVKRSASIEVTLSHGFKTHQKPVIRTFISGYTVQSGVVQIMTNPTNLKGNLLTIRVAVGSTTQLTAITLSYVAFAPSSCPFASFGGSFGQRSFVG